MAQRSGRLQNPAFAVYRLIWQALDWLYPPQCPGCGRVGVRWCADCQGSIVPLGERICPLCGDPSPNRHICADCAQNPPPFRQLRSWGPYQGALREGIHRLKYLKDIGLGEALATHLIDLFAEQDWKIDVVTAVPLSLQRMRQRGYNQAGMLARPFALYVQKPYLPGVLKKVRETTSQVGLTAQERRQNVLGAFQADSKRAAGKTILVIDDVTTTGATIQACAQALIEAGAAGVYGMTLARAMGKSPADLAGR